MTALRPLLEGLAFGESPRWHDGRLWVCDWGAEQLFTVTAAGERTDVVRVPSFPFCIDWLPDGRLLIVSARDCAVLTLTDEGALATYADLTVTSDRPPNNEIVVHSSGNAYVNGGGFDLSRGEPFAPGMIALVTPDGAARIVAGDLHFPNGMAITADETTLVCAESYGRRLTAFTIAADGELTDRRVWADLGEGVPDGICVDADGAVWYADVPNRRCQRVAEGGEVLATVEADRGCFACMLGGADGRALYVIAREWDSADMRAGDGTGQVLVAAEPAPAPHAGRP